MGTFGTVNPRDFFEEFALRPKPSESESQVR